MSTPNLRLMGIDYGTKRVGIAIGQTNSLAFPKEIIKNDSNLLKKIVDLCKKEGVQVVVIGESKDYKQNENPVMKKIREFKEDLFKEEGMKETEIVFHPEFMSSAQASHDQDGLKGNPDLLDASAAAVILQSYIDKQNNK